MKRLILVLITLLTHLSTVASACKSYLDPCAKPFTPNLLIQMCHTCRNGVVFSASQKRLETISLMSMEDLIAMPKAPLHVLFWVAVNNNFHLAAYNAAIRLFALPDSFKSKILSTELTLNEKLSEFYSKSHVILARQIRFKQVI